MSDFVEKDLEQLLPVFENLSLLKLFSKDETARCVVKIRNFEYRLRRVVKRKDDLLAYIQYLMCMTRLISRRRHRLEIFDGKEIVDKGLNRKVDFLYRLAHRRYPADEAIWLAHIEFCRVRGLLATTYGLYHRMLNLLPNRPHLWIEASKWEMEERNSPGNARRVLHKGLRLNKACPNLWIYALKIELLVLEKALKGRQVLNGQEEGDEIKDADPKDLKLASIVFRHAVKNVEDRNFCLELMEQAAAFPFASSLTEEIDLYMNSQFGRNEEQIDYAIRQEYKQRMTGELMFYNDSGMADQRLLHACARYMSEIRACNSYNLRRKYINFLRAEFYARRGDPATTKEIYSRMLFAYAFTYRQSDVRDEGFFIDWAAMCPIKAMKISILQTGLKQLPGAAALRIFLINCQLMDGVPEDQLMVTMKFQSLPNSIPLWKRVTNIVVNRLPQRMDELFQASVGANREILNHVKRAYLNLVFWRTGLSEARYLFQRLINIAPTCLSVYTAFIDMEMSQVPMSIKHIRQCFQKAVTEHSSDDFTIWLRYYTFEANHGDPLCCNDVYQRAVLNLPPLLAQRFTEEVLCNSEGGRS